MAIKLDTLAARLTGKRWVVWRYQPNPDGGKPRKAPFSPRTGEPGWRSGWSSLADAQAAYNRGGYDGLGYVRGAGLVCIDIDNCIAADGSVEPWAQELVDSWPVTYWERSPSGGVKGYFRGDSKTHVVTINGHKVEILGDGGYTTVTGDQIGDCLDFAELPAELVKSDDATAAPAAIEAPEATEADIAEWEAKVLAGGDSIDGQNGSAVALWWFAEARRHNVPEDRALAFIVEKVNPTKAVPPWAVEGDQGLRKKLKDGFAKADEKNEQGAYTAAGRMATRVAAADADFDILPRDDAPSVALATEDDAPAAVGKLRAQNDTGNAERFSERHGAVTKQVTAWEKPIVYNGRVWRLDGAMPWAVDLATDIPALINADAVRVEGTAARNAIRKHALKSGDLGRLRAMVTLHLGTADAQLDHEAIDAKPFLFNCQNVTVELLSELSRPFAPGDLLTQMSPVVWPTQYKPPAMWLAHLDLVLRECADKADVIAFIQRYFGYCLTGSTAEQLLLIFCGSGKNGKTATLETMTGLLGLDYASTVPASFLASTRNEQHPTEIASLFRKRFIHASEFAATDSLDEAKVKQLVDTGRMRARRMREDFWEFHKTHKVILDTNHPPRVDGSDFGIWRRLATVPFNTTIPAEQRILGYSDRLKDEWGQILRWAVRGLHDYTVDGLNPPKSIITATAEYRNENDPLAEFLTDCCVIAPGGSVAAAALYDAYSTWTMGKIDGMLNRNDFGARMRGVSGVTKEHTRTGKVYAGIRLKA